MTSSSLPNAFFRDHLERRLRDAGFNVGVRQVAEGLEPVLLAENPYFVIAFQVFDVWGHLVDAAGRIELALADLIAKSGSTSKTWDAYLVLACRDVIRSVQELNQFSDLAYNTRLTRKIVRAGLGDSVSRLDDIAKQFVTLTIVRTSARGRDPLSVLGEKLVERGCDKNEVNRLITVFKERGDVIDV